MFVKENVYILNDNLVDTGEPTKEGIYFNTGEVHRSKEYYPAN
jgi:hypothetical protein